MDVALRKGIDWVGYVDWTARDFHGYETRLGSTYNAYLIRDEKTVLVDTVKEQYSAELIDHIKQFSSLAEIDYIVCNHAEPDHAGSLPKIMDVCPNATLICNQKCRAILEQEFKTQKWDFQIIEDGESISIGERTLKFINTPMVHWPESMFTYIPEEKLLFSMDAFGQHYASSHRFDDQESLTTVMAEAKKYFANIVMSYGKPIQRAVAKTSDLEIETIAPSHGVIWRTHLPKILAAYQKWATHTPLPKVLVAYDTMWKSTEKMAKAILKGALERDVEAQLINLREGNITQLATEILDSAAIAVGSPTLNKTLMPEVAGALTYLRGLAPTGKCGFAFGSHGWSGGGARDVENYLKEMKFELLRSPLTCKYLPREKTLQECRELGRILADKALQFKK